jgi:drug/metabolite transporter (DMT)-like permease
MYDNTIAKTGAAEQYCTPQPNNFVNSCSIYQSLILSGGHFMKRNWRLIASLVLIGAIWALISPLTKIAVIGGYRNFGIIFWSSSIAVIILGTIVAVRGFTLPVNFGALGRYVFVALFGTMLPSAASYTAAEHLPAGVISVCLSLGPLFSLPLAVILSLDRATWMRVLGLVLGLVGVLLIMLPETSLPDPTKSYGDSAFNYFDACI